VVLWLAYQEEEPMDPVCTIDAREGTAPPPLLLPQPVRLLLVRAAVFVVAQGRPGAAKPMAGVFGGVILQPLP
jgi:hypothetical protein